MTVSKFKTEEYSKKQSITLPNVISLAVYNNGECIAYVNKLPIYPGNKQIIVAPDFTVSNLDLSLTFEPKPVVEQARPDQPVTQVSSNIPEITPTPIAPNLRQTVIFIYKHIE